MNTRRLVIDYINRLNIQWKLRGSHRVPLISQPYGLTARVGSCFVPRRVPTKNKMS